jgi:anhydro-N-acetylmuramic acid kinase
VVSSAQRGLPPQQVEAAAFAWLARAALKGEALDLQSTTGARGARVLGAIYPA